MTNWQNVVSSKYNATHLPHCETWWWKHHAAQTEKQLRVDEKLNGAKYRAIIEEELLEIVAEVYYSKPL